MSPDAVYAIPLGALVVAAASLVYNTLAGKRSTVNDELSTLYRQVERLKGELGECSAKNAVLEQENLKLMRRLYINGGGTP